MLGFYTPVLILQAICIYHAYKHNVEQRWYWFILIFPGFGCAFYLYHHFYNRASINAITETVKVVVNSNYRLEQLEKALEFSESYQNRINLADAYVEYGRFEDALKLYQESRSGFMANDVPLRMKLLQAFYYNKNYAEAIGVGSELEGERDFKNSEQRLAYAWSLHYDGKTTDAEKVFQDLDKPFTNYRHRMEYCKFLADTSKKAELKEKLGDLMEEFDHIRGPERKIYRDIISETKELHAVHVNNKSV
jgi:hypothetical protein